MCMHMHMHMCMCMYWYYEGDMHMYMYWYYEGVWRTLVQGALLLRARSGDHKGEVYTL